MLKHHELSLHLQRNHGLPPEKCDGEEWREHLTLRSNHDLESFHLRLHAGQEQPLPLHWHAEYYSKPRSSE